MVTVPVASEMSLRSILGSKVRPGIDQMRTQRKPSFEGEQPRSWWGEV